jgi:hypothetical protein
VASARRLPGSVVGTVDPSAAAAVEVVSDPPLISLGAAFAADTQVGRVITLRNTSSRALELTISPGTADGADIEVDVVPAKARLRPGAKVQVAVTARVPLLPRAPAALGGAVAVKVRDGANLKIPWTITVPVVGLDLIRNAKLSSRSFTPSDVQPSVLTLTLGRVDGSLERPQLLSLEEVMIDLYRGERGLGQLALVRDLLPGRYSFGITGRGVDGKRLPPGDYELRVIAIPVGGGFPNEETIPFAIR